MNRERRAFGDNSYQREIGLNPDFFLKMRMNTEKMVKWLDMCCGRGKALLQVMQKFRKENIDHRFLFLGVDLVGMFDPAPEEWNNVRLMERSLYEFKTNHSFDLISCIHGLGFFMLHPGSKKRYKKKPQNGVFGHPIAIPLPAGFSTIDVQGIRHGRL